MKVGLGADVNAFDMKEDVKEYLAMLGYEVVDYGVYEKNDTDYPQIAATVAHAIKAGEVERGILFCGTGIGMAIAANKVKGIRAAQTHDVYSAERAQLSNNAQIITMGAKVIGHETAKTIAREYLSNAFTMSGSGKNSARKIDEIMEMEKIS
ncbi:RpiB/LacA/LacB family sugar-phosphate isomerase [Enterococcus sp. LJL120]